MTSPALCFFAVVLVIGCGGTDRAHDRDAGGGLDGAAAIDAATTRDDAEVLPDASGSALVPQAAECSLTFPAFACDGDPSGTWMLVSQCARRFDGCPPDSVTLYGTADATLVIEASGTFTYTFAYDLESHYNVPRSCLGASCDSIGCFGTDTCSCVNGSSTDGTDSGSWTTSTAPGRISFRDSVGTVDFCAGASRADSLLNSVVRRIWVRGP